ncbi:DUF5994 family protein [Streptomyces sp. NPDC006289]|uniref:DUF5994 family protein n=1 Tax=Streptomyces sp. NPDC006289 TaxID=3156744 RepID=UPI0033B39C7F
MSTPLRHGHSPGQDAAPHRHGPLRLRLTEQGKHSRLDGAWWPRSRDLDSELPKLIARLDLEWGRIIDVTVNRRLWPSVPHHVGAGTHTVRLGWFDAEQDPHVLMLFSYPPGHWELLVVPPETESEDAARLMAGASRAGNLRTASALVDPASTDRWGSDRWTGAGPRDWGAEKRATARGR